VSYSTNVVSNYQTAEYGKFVQYSPGDTRYPAISVTKLRYLDSTLFPPGCSYPPISSVDVFPKYAVLSYISNPEDFNITLSASNVNIGDVGIIDHSTGNDVYAQVTQIDTIGLTRVGAVTVKTYGVSPVSGNVTATILEQVPEIYTFHNFGIFTHRGWTMSDDLIPMITIRAKNTTSKTVKILEYELGNNNANSSTIGYVWYEDATITGTVPAFSSVNTDAEYRFYTDAFGSNTPNGFTGGTKRHSGIVIGKNSEAESTLSNIPLSANGKTLTMCVQRLDSATKLDLWTAMTIGIF